MAEKTLTKKQKEFCKHYVFDWNGTRSYKEAYKGNISDNTAAVNAHKLLSNTKIQDYIKDIQTDQLKLTNKSTYLQVVEFQKIIDSDETTTRERIEALKEQSKLLGLYATEKRHTDITSDGEKVTGFNIVISDKTS